MKKLAGSIAGLALALGAGELALRLLPVQQGINAADRAAEWPVHHLVPHSRITWSSGWRLQNVVHSLANGAGYVAPFEYERGAAIVAVLGDSYIESLMNPYASTLQGRLPLLLPGGPQVYNFGASGAALPDYLGVASLLRRDFRVQKLVVLVGEGDFVEGFHPGAGQFGWAPQQPELVRLREDSLRSPTTKLLRSLALVRYVRGNLKLTPAALFKSRPSGFEAGCRPEELAAGDGTLIDAFVAALPRAYGIAAGSIVLVHDDESARQSLYDGLDGPGTAGAAIAGPVCPTRDGLALQQLLERARAAGMHVLETRPLFAAHWRATHERVDHSPLDWHWNGTAHRLVAEAVARELAAGP